jgi:hypothetical protein
MALFPQQSFEHTLREISVNRDDPCELIRELISNSYDAQAKNIYVIPLYQKKGLLFIDDGCGLSMSEDKFKRVSPYVAFFSIGKGTKTRGERIGYKCQGSKLCFAARRFSLITRCPGEAEWRWLSIHNPKTLLNETYNITPTLTNTPWELLQNDLLSSPGKLTQEVVSTLDATFFKTQFATGLMIIIDEFEVDNYDHYFSVTKSSSSYLKEYIRFYTAHADVRRIANKTYGFRASEINQLKKHVVPPDAPVLHLWTSLEGTDQPFEKMIGGWPYLPVPAKGSEESNAQSPEVVPRLRDGTFFARHADSFKYEGQLYNLILAIDGKRRALKLYSDLSRPSKAQSGIRFSDQRGVILCSQGIRVCQYQQILDHQGMNGWSDLAQGVDHFCLFIDGPFELVTNRNLPAQSATSLLREPQFVKNVADFLKRVSRESGGEVLRELVNRLRREATAVRENEYIAKNQLLKEDAQYRLQFRVEIPDCAPLAEKWFIAPRFGEEHFVGALYTLFSSCIPNDSKIKQYWHRPLTFNALGIDALGVSNEERYLDEKQLEYIEYKYLFSAAEEFNHPLTLTDRIICWQLLIQNDGETIEDSFGYQATVGEPIMIEDKRVGYHLTDIRHKYDGKERQHAIMVLSLDALLDATFTVQRRQPPTAKSSPKPKTTGK